MTALVEWLLAVLVGVCAVAFYVHHAGRGIRWVHEHLLWLVVAAYAIAVMAVCAVEKPATNTIHVIRVGLRPDGAIMPYGAPLREIQQ